MHAACDSEEGKVGDFLHKYLMIHGFLVDNPVELPFLICGEFTSVNPGWWINDGQSSKIRSLGENKRAACMMIPEAQLTAEVIAADQKN
jgi:hypothetical protein